MAEISLPPGARAAFFQAVWSIARLIPPGRVSTYGQIALYLPCPESVKETDFLAFRARWVGEAMAACPSDVPWQRVINSQGKISQRPGAAQQRTLLEAEGIVFNDRAQVDLKRFGWNGPSPAWLKANGFVIPPGEDASQPGLF
ncbi:MAG TPA: 6-O-methylguanine DNA methyltransferase [Anaerolinea thermolimosa]|uniref:6-O-methylguanine DNA methyltransferase n=1 Tax=Anaerolinea thermolimosa TaxID=229919 RepID=A0A3D1JDY8_9CHLR|nr:6-O-methylguanine DNA methyltransferase [Anaerolinea thermolimosa]